MSKDRTEIIWGATAIWLWGKPITGEIFELQRLLRKSPLGKYVKELEAKVKKVKP